jgi:hypothetical protein
MLVLDAAIASPLFWAYRAMMDNLFTVITHMMTWSEACACHLSTPDLHGSTKFTRRKQFERQMGVMTSCPMRTRRAPCMSAGEFHAVLADMFAVRSASIMVHILPRLHAKSDRDIVLRDWERGRQAFTFTVAVKLAPWQRLPLLLCGGAHSDEQVARGLVCKAYAMHAEETFSHVGGHPLSRLFFDKDSPLFPEVIRFMQGRPRTELQNLMFRLGQLALIPETERLVEGMHAIMHKHIRSAPHHTVCHAALSMHLPEIKSALDADPQFLQHLAASCFRVRTPVNALKELGLGRYLLALS